MLLTLLLLHLQAGVARRRRRRRRRRWNRTRARARAARWCATCCCLWAAWTDSCSSFWLTRRPWDCTGEPPPTSQHARSFKLLPRPLPFLLRRAFVLCYAASPALSWTFRLTIMNSISLGTCFLLAGCCRAPPHRPCGWAAGLRRLLLVLTILFLLFLETRSLPRPLRRRRHRSLAPCSQTGRECVKSASR